MRDDNDIITALQLHDDWLKTDDHVAIRLPPAVAVVVFIVVAGLKVLREAVLDLLVGEAIADAAVEFVECLPFQFLVFTPWSGDETRCLDGALQGGGPDDELGAWGDGFGDELGEALCVLFAAFGDTGVPADFACEIELGLAVLGTSLV